ncbi:MAG TPA: class I SAM-dependent methyltransferase [Terriglobales bacterium]|nr:class I SAM-dependent methyltransferase [Terriglobales bacterium]
MKKRPDINRFALLDYNFAAFEPGARVLDIGCGKGGQLLKLSGRGCQSIGLDPNIERVRTCVGLGLKVAVGEAEHLPFHEASFDGIICKGVIPYTSEPVAFHEIARVLKPGGVAQIAYLSSGFYLRLLLLGQGGRVKQRVYGLRTFLNTWLFALTGKVLPGVWGNTLYQSRRRLSKYYAWNRLTLVRETPSKNFLGLPVFIYHTVRARPERATPINAFATKESAEVLTAVAS